MPCREREPRLCWLPVYAAGSGLLRDAVKQLNLPPPETPTSGDNQDVGKFILNDSKIRVSRRGTISAVVGVYGEQKGGGFCSHARSTV